jgi:NADH-quinone oxidoreductase subunit L
MDIGSILWLVPALPALGALLNGTRAVLRPLEPKNKSITNLIALASTGLSAIIATWVVLTYVAQGWHHPFEVVYYSWIPAGMGNVHGMIANFGVDFGFQIDTLSCTMLMVVTWVGFLIHVYATGYMAHDRGYTRFFSYFNLFMFMMLLLVLGNNYVVMFVGWEGVGLCSYLLIGFYYDKTFAADAGKKAFIVNRIGDFGFLLGLFLIFNYFGTADYTTVFGLAAAHPETYSGIAAAIGILLFIGAAGKSAQLPLYVWLPDAMAGPTPVSALIHAATMVTAGVYMVVRSNVIYRLAPEAMAVVAIVGALTAIFAATIGVAQNDIKKVLAYSTVSQLGFMFLGAGVGAFGAAIFHLMTHAFFKACLFLGSGSVIHGCGGEQDMRKMGGLKKYMPRTRWTMLLATFAIAGFPPFLVSGFFSKDEILLNAFITRFESLGTPWMYIPVVCWILGVIAATFTAFYMFRLYYMTFEGGYRGASAAGIEESAPAHGSDNLIAATPPLDQPTGHGHAPAGKGHGDHHDAHGAPHESPLSMTGVLMVLAVLSIIGGWVGLPMGNSLFERWIHPVIIPLAEGHGAHAPHATLAIEVILISIAIAVSIIGILIAWRFYGKDQTWSLPKRLAAAMPNLYRVVANKYYVDEIYHATVIRGTIGLCLVFSWIDRYIVDGLVNGVRNVTVVLFGHGSNLVDRFVVDGAVNGVALTARASSTLLRRIQSGFVQNYALIMGSGIVLLAVVYLVARP